MRVVSGCTIHMNTNFNQAKFSMINMKVDNI